MNYNAQYTFVYLFLHRFPPWGRHVLVVQHCPIQGGEKRMRANLLKAPSAQAAGWIRSAQASDRLQGAGRETVYTVAANM
jgi:hypothetical protein